MSEEEPLAEFYKYVERNERRYVEGLREVVGIRSVSAWPESRKEILKMIEYAKSFGERLGARTELVANPKLSEDSTLPPLLQMTFDDAPEEDKRCVLCYGHLDVQPAKKEDGWSSEDPFALEEVTVDGNKVVLRGRGSSDDKGPAMSWLWAIEAHRDLEMELPVKIKLLFEGMEEYGSVGLPEFIFAEAAKVQGWLSDVDYVVVSDNMWTSEKTPCLTYGLRGMLYCEVEVKGGSRDLHSGTHGGAMASEPLVDLIHLLGSLVDPPGSTDEVQKPLHERIRVPGILADVAPFTEEEKRLYEAIDFDLDKYANVDLGGASLPRGCDKTSILASRWRFPTLSIHGVEGAFSDPGAKTVVPGTVKGKFSLRLVPAMTPKKTEALIRAHLQVEWAKLGSQNTLTVRALHGGPAWVSDTKHPNYLAGAKANFRVHGIEPNFTREGGSIPLANWLEDATKVNCLLLPTGAADDGHHAQNEKYNLLNLINGIKVLGTYLHEIASLDGPRPSKCKCFTLPFDPSVVGAFAGRGFRCKCEI